MRVGPIAWHLGELEPRREPVLDGRFLSLATALSLARLPANCFAMRMRRLFF